MTAPDGRYVAYLDDWGDLTVLLPQNPDLLAELATRASAHARETQAIGSGTRILLRQDIHLMALKRFLNDNGGCVDVTRKTLHTTPTKLDSYPQAFVQALRDGGLLPSTVDERKTLLPHVLMRYARSEDGELSHIFPDGEVTHMAELIPPHTPLPPLALFDKRTPDSVRTDLYNAWRTEFYVAALPKAEEVALKGDILCLTVTENAALERLATMFECGDKWTEATDADLCTGAGLPAKTRTFLRRNGFI
ncbi:MAG: hypothetical protein GC134_07865 [Proteobacteria bacterium]|nr:hypothetical protein [Pseudomonadota bacterium]